MATSQYQKILNPWNKNNVEIQLKDVKHLLQRYGLNIKQHRPELFQQAFVHTSYVDHSIIAPDTTVVPCPPNCMGFREADNEQLEYLGDSVLGCIIASYLKRRYPGEGEGFLTRLRTKLVNNETLGEFAKVAGFSKWLILSRHMEAECNGRENLRILGSALEAWIGALYSQQMTPLGAGDFHSAYTWLIGLIEAHADFVEMLVVDVNYKDRLLRFYQQTYHQPPRYKEVEVVGPIHDRIFTMGVLGPQAEDGSVPHVIAQATARSKPTAEQEASRLALIKLGAIK
jgi:ribonuclease-3